jgi:hypothetical protein
MYGIPYFLIKSYYAICNLVFCYFFNFVKSMGCTPNTSKASLAAHVDGITLKHQWAKVEARVAEAVAEGEQWSGRHVQIAFVDVGGGPPIPAAKKLPYTAV